MVTQQIMRTNAAALGIAGMALPMFGYRFPKVEAL